MNWGYLKKKINSLSKEDLKKEVIFIAEDKSFSGVVNRAVKCKTNLFYLYDDDPAWLMTKTELKERGFTDDDINELEVYVSKGDLFLEVTN